MEHNPYSAPKSELTTDADLYRPGRGWKSLFFLLTPLVIWAQYDVVIYNEDGDPIFVIVFSTILYGLLLVCLFGLAFRKRIGTPAFWWAYLPLQIVNDLYDFHKAFFPLDELHSLVMFIVLLCMVVPIILFPWYAIYRYILYLRFVQKPLENPA